MPSLDPKRRIPGYDDMVAQLTFLSDSYKGGTEYGADKYLHKHPRELAAHFKSRKDRAYLLNYTAAVVDAYVAAVFKREPVRNIPDAFKDFVEDATGAGDTLTDFVREAVTYALATLKAYVVVDIDDDGLPYVHLLHPANLLDYAKDQSGAFLWALVAEKHVTDEDPFSERSEADRLRLWTPSQWSLYDDKGTQIEEGTNEAGEVPLIEVVPGNMPLPIFDIAKINQAIYNYSSQIDEIFATLTFPQLYIESGEGVETEDGTAVVDDALVISTGRVLQLPTGTSTPPGFLAPPNDPAQILREERSDLVDAIYSLAGQERRDPDSQKVQSGVAKAYDFREQNERLVSTANIGERTEEEIFFLLNAYGFSGEYEVNYQKDFNVRDFTLMLEDYLNIQKTDLPAPAKRRAMKELAGQIADDASPEEKREIAEAVDAVPDAKFEQQQAAAPKVSDLLGRNNLETANPANRGRRVTTDTLQP